MTTRGGDEQRHVLARAGGDVLLSAPLAFLKGVLEAEPAASLLAVSADGPLAGLSDLMQGPGSEVLRAHELRIVRVPSAQRALALALDAARAERIAIAAAPNQQLGPLRSMLADAARRDLPREGAAVLVLDNAPQAAPAACPVRAARELDLPCLVAASVPHLRDLAEAALLMSRSARRPALLVTHTRLFDAFETFEARPNRIDDSVETMIARRWDRVRARRSETSDPLKLLRRLELNRIVGLPSPGERVALGFITVGPAQRALEHLLHAFNLVGRVPHLALGVTNPVDGAAIERVLQRCERIIILEARPGSSRAPVLAAAQDLHRRGLPAATIWSHSVPGAGTEGEELTVLADDALHPSRLARLLVRPLQALRPAARIERLLAPPPPPLPPRGDPGPRVIEPEVSAALDELARFARRAERRMRQQMAADEKVAAPPVFVVGGITPHREVTGRTIPVEIVGAKEFEATAAAMIRHAARERRTWMMLIADIGGSEGIDPLRLARAMIPPESAARVRLEEASFSAPNELLELIAGAGGGDEPVIVVVRDPEPARFRTEQWRRAQAEIDRLGYEPRQRAVWSLDRSCAVRDPVDEDAGAEVSPTEADGGSRARWRIDDAARPWYALPALRIRPLRHAP